MIWFQLTSRLGVTNSAAWSGGFVRCRAGHSYLVPDTLSIYIDWVSSPAGHDKLHQRMATRSHKEAMGNGTGATWEIAKQNCVRCRVGMVVLLFGWGQEGHHKGRFGGCWEDGDRCFGM